MVVADAVQMRRAIMECLIELDRPVVVVSDGNRAEAALDGVEQVMVYAPDRNEGIDWAARMLERHPGLRIVYLSPSHWASLDYKRARCLIAPHAPGALNPGLLLRAVRELST